MKLIAVPLLSFSVLLTLSACGGKVVFSEGDGGAGGSGNTSTQFVVATTSTPSSVGPSTVSTNVGPSSVSTNVGPSSVNVSVGPSVGSTSTGISTCDTGQIGNPQSSLCNDCVNCAVTSTCAAEFDTWNNNSDAQAFNNCLNQCGGGPGCFNQCKNQHPAGAQVYQALISCLLCSGCPSNCNSPQQCPP